MRRRFGRRRRSEDGARSLDVSRELDRVVEQRAVPVTALQPVAEGEVPATLAAVGTGSDSEGASNVVAVSPDSGAAAWLGGMSVALRLAQEEGFRGRLWVLSPRWRAPARALLKAVGETPFEVVALATSAAGGREGAEAGATRVDAESGASVALSLDLAPGREGLLPPARARAVEALRGLAAKHGGVLQREAAGLRLVLMGQPVALLKASELEILRPRRDRIALAAENLSDAFDQLEGSLRKVLSDRKNRDGEPGLRAREAAAFAAALDLTAPTLWPIGLGEECPIDVLGLAPGGQPVAGALRRELNLSVLLPIAEAAALLEPVAAWLLPGSQEGGNGLPVRLAVAAEQSDASALRVLQALLPGGDAFDLRSEGRGGVSFVRRNAGLPLPRAVPARVIPDAAPDREPTSAPEVAVSASAPAAKAEASTVETKPPGGAEERPARRFEEMSLFDLSEEDDARGEGAGRRRRRRGGRGRSRSAAEAPRDRDEAVVESTEPAPESRDEPERPARPRRRRRRRARPLMVEDVGEEELDEEDEALGSEVAADEASGLGDSVDGTDETDEGDGSEDDVDALQEDATVAVLDPTPEERPESRPARPVRSRAAIVAHADPVSIGAAVLLARDLRLLEGIWIYQQDELMNFFRSVATDLRDGVAITLIGFTASPARETLQTASLYRDRLTWFDHHEWPPEDVEALRQAIGPEEVHIVPGTGSSLPLVAAECTRRSRFSDKFLDMLTGRFSPHDYERWGRLWWWRLTELAKQSGERRRELAALLTGRPSDLAREAADHPSPPLPPEAEFVASHDLPLVHFGGYTMLRFVVPETLDLMMTARIARERYGAQLAIAARENNRVVVLVGDDSNNRRSFDLGAMAEHLATKFTWVERLPGADHVTRFRVADLLERPERLEEIVAEVAMGRSVLEG